MNNGINLFWPTPVLKGQIDNKNLLTEVCDYIFLNENLDQPASDFQKYDVLKNGTSVMKEFTNQIVYPAFREFLKFYDYNLDDISGYKFRSWLCGTRCGYHIPIHNHSGSQFSGIFYLLCDENKGGDLIMVDPRTNANRGYEHPFKAHFANKIYQPKSGDFIIFPGFVYHQTIPFVGTMRLAMPVDLFL